MYAYYIIRGLKEGRLWNYTTSRKGKEEYIIREKVVVLNRWQNFLRKLLNVDQDLLITLEYSQVTVFSNNADVPLVTKVEVQQAIERKRRHEIMQQLPMN